MSSTLGSDRRMNNGHAKKVFVYQHLWLTKKEVQICELTSVSTPFSVP